MVLTDFMELEELDLTRNKITKLEVPSMPLLKNLRVSDNLLTALPSLSVFPALAQLSATFNSIASISCTTPLAHLTTIYLKGNKLQELSFIRCMPALKEVDICNNKIKDMRPLLLVSPDKIAFTGNPVDSSLLDDAGRKRLLGAAVER